MSTDLQRSESFFRKDEIKLNCQIIDQFKKNVVKHCKVAKKPFNNNNNQNQLFQYPILGGRNSSNRRLQSSATAANGTNTNETGSSRQVGQDGVGRGLGRKGQAGLLLMGKTAASSFLEDFLKKNTNLSTNYRVLSSTEFSGAEINWLFSGDASIIWWA